VHLSEDTVKARLTHRDGRIHRKTKRKPDSNLDFTTARAV
jgi:hypothetical protein